LILSDLATFLGTNSLSVLMCCKAVSQSINQSINQLINQYGRGTVVSIISSRCTCCCPETSHGKITRHYSQYCTVAFCYVHKFELSYVCPGHDIKLHQHQVILYRIGCWESFVCVFRSSVPRYIEVNKTAYTTHEVFH